MKLARRTAVLATLLVALSVATVAVATLNIYVGRGVGSTRLGWNDHTAATKISSPYHKWVRDTRYSYTVYKWYVGPRMSSGKYPVVLLAKSDHRVFYYEINSSAYPTSAGVRVGSSMTTLRSKYPTASGPMTSGLYQVFTLKGSYNGWVTYTKFYCKNGKVVSIQVRR